MCVQCVFVCIPYVSVCVYVCNVYLCVHVYVSVCVHAVSLNNLYTLYCPFLANASHLIVQYDVQICHV